MVLVFGPLPRGVPPLRMACRYMIRSSCHSNDVEILSSVVRDDLRSQDNYEWECVQDNDDGSTRCARFVLDPTVACLQSKVGGGGERERQREKRERERERGRGGGERARQSIMWQQ